MWVIQISTCCYYSKIYGQFNMKNWLFQLSTDMSTFGNKAALWWRIPSVYFLHLSIHVIWRLHWLAPWLSPPASLRSCFVLEMRCRIGKNKKTSFLSLTEIGLKTTSALRKPCAFLNHCKSTQDQSPPLPLGSNRQDPQEVGAQQEGKQLGALLVPEMR